MKKLFLIRHAKSSWDNQDQTDIDRTLNKKGMADAPMMAKFLQESKNHPDLLISSPAIRALTTAQIFAAQFGVNPEVIVTDSRIYEAGMRELMSVARELENRYESVFLFGHNPGLTSFTNLLGNKFFPEMPTCAIAGIEFELNSWLEIERGTGRVFLFDYPMKHSK
ncbi:MAG: histidine phosphatase family protein [Melioribacteraceae bacterium]